MKIVGRDLSTIQAAELMRLRVRSTSKATVHCQVDTETGEFTEKTLSHEGNEVRELYAA
jgi:hypothetical protein